MELKVKEVSQIVSLDDAQVELVQEGASTLALTGTVTLTLLTFQVPSQPPPLPPRAIPSSSTSFGAPPPLPPRSVSPLPTQPPAYSDSWLVLSLTSSGVSEPLLELPIASTTRIITIPPRSYLIRTSLDTFGAWQGPIDSKKSSQDPTLDDDEGGTVVKLTLSSDTDSGDREVFENSLWSLTSFSTSSPAGHQTAQRGASDPHDLRSQLVLVDEEDGTVIGELTDSLNVHEDPSLSLEDQGYNEKEPVVIDFSQTSTSSVTGLPAGMVTVRPVSKWNPTPNPTGSTIINFGDFVGRGIVVGAESVARALEIGADMVKTKTKPVQTPLVFSPRTKKTFAGGHNLTAGAVKISGKTVAMIGELAAGFGDRAGKALGIQSTPSGKPPTGIRGLVNKSLVAFNTVLDSVETGGKALLEAGSNSSTAIVEHKLGPDAAGVSRHIGGSVKHCALVYIDARGVTRRALLKTVGKAALRAKLADGREVILENDQALAAFEAAPPSYQDNGSSSAGKQKEKEKDGGGLQYVI